MQRILKTLFSVCLVFLAVSLVISPSESIEAAKDAVYLCMNVIIPSLFPFFICSGLFITLGMANALSRALSPIMRPAFNVPGSGALAFLLGIISGYPVGARCAVDLYESGQCSRHEAERLLAFCNNSGPLFILGAVGVGMLKSPELGRMLYLSHMISALLVGALFKFYKIRAVPDPKELSSSRDRLTPKNIGICIGETMANSVDTIFKVCGFVIIFSVFANALPTFAGAGFVYGILEITGGVNNFIVNSPAGPMLKMALISFFIAFSGISVMFQVSSIVSPSGLSMKPYAIGKIFQGIFSFLITYLMFLFVPVDVDVFSIAGDYSFLYQSPKQVLITALIMIFWCVLSMVVMVLSGMVSERFISKKRKRGRK